MSRYIVRRKLEGTGVNKGYNLIKAEDKIDKSYRVSELIETYVECIFNDCDGLLKIHPNMTFDDEELDDDGIYGFKCPTCNRRMGDDFSEDYFEENMLNVVISRESKISKTTLNKLNNLEYLKDFFNKEINVTLFYKDAGKVMEELKNYPDEDILILERDYVSLFLFKINKMSNPLYIIKNDLSAITRAYDIDIELKIKYDR